MTPPDARARVEAWMEEICPHTDQTIDEDLRPRKCHCTDCLLAFAAAQRAEERDEFVDLLVKLRDENGDGWLDRVRINLLTRVIDEVHSRARREGAGGEK